MKIFETDHPDAEPLRVKFQRLRGCAISSFAEAEFAMGDLLLAMKASGQLNDIDFGYRPESRVKAFRKVCLYATDDALLIRRIHWACSGFEDTIDDENALVHGSAELFPSERSVKLLRISPSKSDLGQMISYTFDLDTMEERVREFDHVCLNLVGLSWTMACALGLAERPSEHHSIFVHNIARPVAADEKPDE